jgi:ABC-type transport system involved in multi-copper enzyme maturation permease subunit
MSDTPRSSWLDLLLPSAYRAAFGDEHTFRDNPILTREERRDSRRRDTPLLLLLTLATLLGAFGLTVYLLGRSRDANGLRYGIPAWLGGSYGTLLLAVFSGVHVWFVAHAAYRRTHPFFLQEYRRNTLNVLLGTRIPPFQLVLQGAQHPFRQGMLVAAVGLPFYAYAYSQGGVSLLDLAGVCLIFSMVACAPPRWFVPVFAEVSAEEIVKKTKSYALASSPYAFLAYGLNILGIVWICGFFTSLPILSMMFGSGWTRSLLLPLASLIPASIDKFWWPVPLTWVVCAARWLFSPLPFYAFALPPVVLLLPLFLYGRILGVWETSMFLRVGDMGQMAGLWDLRAYWRARRLYGGLLLFVMLGYLWCPYVGASLTASLVSLSVGGNDLALTGLVWLLGSWAALCVWALTSRVIAEWRSARIGLVPRPGALKQTLQPLLYVYAFYLTGCLMAGRFPFPPSALGMLIELLAVTVAGTLLFRFLPTGPRILYLAVLLLPLAFWFVPHPGYASYLACLSPLAGLLSLTPHTQRILDVLTGHQAVAPPPTMCIAVTAALGLALSLNARPRKRKGPVIFRPGAAAPRTLPAVPKVGASAPAAPPVYPNEWRELPAWTARGSSRARTPFKEKKEYPAAQRLLAWLGMWVDNAVAMKELRVMLRGRLSRAEIASLLGLLLFLTGFMIYYNDILGEMMQTPAGLIFGDMGNGVFYGAFITLWMLLSTLIAPLIAAGLCAAAFPKERDKSTLGFLLVTPMGIRAILLGKLFGLLLPTLLGLAVVALWCALPAVLLAFAIGPARVLTGFALLLTILLALTFVGGFLGLACSVLLRRESDASALAAFGVMLFVGAVFYMWYNTGDLAPPLLSGLPFWIAWLLGLGALVCALSGALVSWRLARARAGDIAFESAKTQN